MHVNEKELQRRVAWQFLEQKFLLGGSMSGLGIPDVVSDHCTDACKRLGCSIGQLFQKAAAQCRHGNGFSNNDEVGERFYRLWATQGYRGLPPAVQMFVLEVNEGQHRAA